MRKKTMLFMSGNSQAVRIPREFQLEGNEVEIQRRDNTLVIRPKKKTWQSLADSLTMFTDDFMEGGEEAAADPETKAFLHMKAILDTNICSYLIKQQLIIVVLDVAVKEGLINSRFHSEIYS